MRKILIVLVSIVIFLAVVVQVTEAGWSNRRHDAITKDMMMAAAQQTAEGDAQKAYKVYKEMERIKAEEHRRLNSGSNAVEAIFFLMVVGAISVIYFLGGGRVSWVSLVVAVSSVCCLIIIILSLLYE